MTSHNLGTLNVLNALLSPLSQSPIPFADRQNHVSTSLAALAISFADQPNIPWRVVRSDLESLFVAPEEIKVAMMRKGELGMALIVKLLCRARTNGDGEQKELGNWAYGFALALVTAIAQQSSTQQAHGPQQQMTPPNASPFRQPHMHPQRLQGFQTPPSPLHRYGQVQVQIKTEPQNSNPFLPTQPQPQPQPQQPRPQIRPPQILGINRRPQNVNGGGNGRTVPVSPFDPFKQEKISDEELAVKNANAKKELMGANAKEKENTIEQQEIEEEEESTVQETEEVEVAVANPEKEVATEVEKSKEKSPEKEKEKSKEHEEETAARKLKRQILELTLRLAEMERVEKEKESETSGGGEGEGEGDDMSVCSEEVTNKKRKAEDELGEKEKENKRIKSESVEIIE